MRIYAYLAWAWCTAALVACGAGDEGEDMFDTTGGGVSGSGGAAPNATAGPGLSPGTTPGANATTGTTATPGTDAGVAAATTGATGGIAATTGALDAPLDGVAVSAEIAMKMEVFAAQRNTHAQMKCECYTLFGFESLEACLASEPLIDDPMADCGALVLSQDEAEGHLFFDCATPAAVEHTMCLEQTFVCDRPYAFEAFQACASPYVFETSGCWDLSAATAEGLSTCGLRE